MSSVTSSLYINGTLVDRAANRITLNQLSFGIEHEESLDFTQEIAPSFQGTISEGQSVKLTMTDGTTTVTVFNGQVASHVPNNIGTGTISIGYHCVGIRFLANNIFTTGSDGVGTVSFNMPFTDDNWFVNLSALSVGQIVQNYLGLHNTQLSALGITLPPAADLAPLTVVPINLVVLSGRIIDAMNGFLAQWSPKYQLYIDPTSLQFRIVDVTNPANTDTFSLDCDDDPITVDSLSVDTTNCYTRVVTRGLANIDAAILDQIALTLKPGWTHTQETNWTLSDFLSPSNSCTGTLSSLTTGSVTVTPTKGVLSWPINYWNGGTISLILAGGGVQMSIVREVTSVSACAAGGSATVVFDVAIDSLSYTTFEIRGMITGDNLVWRKYVIPDTVVRASDNSPINRHLVKRLSHSVAWAPIDNSVALTISPQGEVYYSSGAFFATFQIYPTNDGITPGYIIFDQPTCLISGSSQASMLAGHPDQVPTDVKVLLPYSQGALSAQAPVSGYEGTAFTEYGIQRTWYRDFPDWKYAQQSNNMGQLAQQILDSVKNAVVSGSLTYYGCPIQAMQLGRGLNITGGLADGTILETMNIAVRQIHVTWPEGAGSAQVCVFEFTNRRKPFLGESLYLHPVQTTPTTMGGQLSGTMMATPELAAKQLEDAQKKIAETKFAGAITRNKEGEEKIVAKRQADAREFMDQLNRTMAAPAVAGMGGVTGIAAGGMADVGAMARQGMMGLAAPTLEGMQQSIMAGPGQALANLQAAQEGPAPFTDTLGPMPAQRPQRRRPMTAGARARAEARARRAELRRAGREPMAGGMGMAELGAGPAADLARSRAARLSAAKAISTERARRSERIKAERAAKAGRKEELRAAGATPSVGGMGMAELGSGPAADLARRRASEAAAAKAVRERRIKRLKPPPGTEL